MSLHTCNIDRDGIDTDVLRDLPINLIKKLASKSSMKVDGYNDALKHAMKAKAGVEGKRLRDFIMEVPGIEAHIINIEKMKSGGELYPEYSKESKGTMGPKYVDTVNPVTTWSNNNKQDPATVRSSIRPLKQAGGSIINDYGKELAIIPKTEGLEFNPMEYLQNYVQTTTLGGKYKKGGINWKKVPADRMFMLGLHKNGGVSKDQDDKKLVVEGNPYERSNYYSFGKGEEKYELNNKDNQTLKKILAEKNLTTANARRLEDKIEILNPNTKEVLLTVDARDVYYPGQDYSNKNNASLARSVDRYNYNLTKEETQLQKEKDWLRANPYNKDLQKSIDDRNSSDAELKAKRAIEDQEWKDQTAKKQYDAMIKRRDSTEVTPKVNDKSSSTTAKSAPVKKQLKPLRKLTQDELSSDKFDTIEKGGQSYKIDPKTKEVFTSDGAKVTDDKFNRNLLEGYKPDMKIIDFPEKEYDLQKESQDRLDVEGAQQAYRETLQGAKIKESLANQIALAKAVVTPVKKESKLRDFFTRTDEEKAARQERKKLRKLKKNDEVKSATNNSKKESELTSAELVEIMAFTKDPAERNRLGALFNAAVERERKQRGEPAQKEGEIIFNNTSKNKRGNKLLKRI